MPDLSVRKLDKIAYEQLRIRAASHGVSMEEEARQIIYQAVSLPGQVSGIFKKYFGIENGIDLGPFILEQHKPQCPHDPINFDE